MTTSPDMDLLGIAARLRDAAGDLARIAQAPSAPPSAPPPTDRSSSTAQSLALLAAAVLRQRQARRRFLPADLFREPGWDMLIAIYVADRAGHPTNVKALVGMVDAPATTAQRWIEHLDRLGLVNRTTDQLDRRRVEVSLTDRGQTALEAYLRAMPTL